MRNTIVNELVEFFRPTWDQWFDRMIANRRVICDRRSCLAEPPPGNVPIDLVSCDAKRRFERPMTAITSGRRYHLAAGYVFQRRQESFDPYAARLRNMGERISDVVDFEPICHDGSIVFLLVDAATGNTYDDAFADAADGFETVGL